MRTAAIVTAWLTGALACAAGAQTDNSARAEPLVAACSFFVSDFAEESAAGAADKPSAAPVPPGATAPMPK
jgi:hypothetical protein